MEVLQGVSGMGRAFDPVDMVANTIGALIGGLAFLLFHKLYKLAFPAGKA